VVTGLGVFVFQPLVLTVSLVGLAQANVATRCAAVVGILWNLVLFRWFVFPPARFILVGIWFFDAPRSALVLAFLLVLAPGIDRDPGRSLERHPLPVVHGRQLAGVDGPADHPRPKPLRRPAEDFITAERQKPNSLQ
jgi:hypothetical protein